MRRMKHGLAAFLTAVLMIPSQPVMAARQTDVLAGELKTMTEAFNGTVPGATGSNGKQEVVNKATSSTAKKKNQVSFNTGNCEYTVVSQEDFWDNETGDDCFEEDGSYTIQIPEENPFFPYEVQFTYNGKKTKQWFMTPDDSVSVGGHTFYVNASFDDTVVTQMSLEVAGETVVVYPEEKEFKDGNGVSAYSLLPLTEKRFSVDLTGFTPAELTQVSVGQIFTGSNELSGDDKVMWCLGSKDDYKTNSINEPMDLSVYTSSGGTTWEMIAGKDNQLAADNIRYRVSIDVTDSSEWLIPSIYKQDDQGNRTEVTARDFEYYDYDSRYNQRELQIEVPRKDLENCQIFMGLEVNPDVFPNVNYDDIKIFQGEYKTAKEAEAGTELTDQLLKQDMSVKDAGFLLDDYGSEIITIVTYQGGNATGCLPIVPYLIQYGEAVSRSRLEMDFYHETENGRNHAGGSSISRSSGGDIKITTKLDVEYAANTPLYLICDYTPAGESGIQEVTAAYKGRYQTIKAAKEAGAEDIKESLFTNNKGFLADYSKGVTFTIFAGEDGAAGQEVYCITITTEETAMQLSGDTLVNFYALLGKESKPVYCYIVDEEQDSYSEYNYITMLVDETADLTELAPMFAVKKGLNLYTPGSSSPEVSGESYHDFSGGPIEYTASAENKKDSRNYWLKILQARSEEGKLYINSLEDEEAKTKVENGVTYSTREIFVDGRHDYVHDILLINEGKNSISDLSVELSSPVVELDDYWTLKGGQELSGFTTIQETTTYGELPNMAKIRLKAKEDAEGQDVTGTLTIKDGDKVLMVLTLTGMIGDPSIITKEIPAAVKYVPYGTMIQNNNKYSWNKVSYTQIGGKLPEGMEVKKNGEIYGVPKETGEFKFTVMMENSTYEFSDSIKTFTLIVNENTDTNVDGATDEGYTVTQRIPNITMKDTNDYTFVSQGVYGEFVDVFLDGEKLVKGTDYDSESGSTRITIRSQTLKSSNQTGTHTLGVEFRTSDTQTLKRAAQNYRITGTGSGTTGSSSGVHGVSAAAKSNGNKKGHTDALKGIITGTGAGYSSWQKDETGWKLCYADGTYAAGHMVKQSDGTEAEQILWEKINGAWYAFGADKYLKSGWVLDYSNFTWYSVSVDSGMRTGWYQEPQDGFTYYLVPETGAMITGWRQIDEKWHYFNEISPTPTWNYDERTGTWSYDILSKHQPFGSMYKNKKTPDGYYVDEKGVWKENIR